MEVRDIIVSPPTSAAYTMLKTELIKRLNTSQEEKTRRLLECEEMGDRTPSQFLRHLQGLAGVNVSENVLRTLWCKRLPTDMQAILAAHKDLGLKKLAELADSIREITGPRPSVAVTDASDSLAEQMRQLTITLQQEIAAIRHEVNARTSDNQRRKRQSRQRSRSTNRFQAAGWYHARHGSNAKKCTAPCSWTNQGNSTGSR